MLTVEIRIRGCIDEHWSPWFDDLALAHRGGETVLSGRVADHAALYGLLARLRDLGLPLISVVSVGETEG